MVFAWILLILNLSVFLADYFWMYGDNNQGNPPAHALGFTAITEGIRAFPGSIMQKDVSTFVKEELPCLLKQGIQLSAPDRGCASAPMN